MLLQLNLMLAICGCAGSASAFKVTAAPKALTCGAVSLSVGEASIVYAMPSEPSGIAPISNLGPALGPTFSCNSTLLRISSSLDSTSAAEDLTSAAENSLQNEVARKRTTPPRNSTN